MAPHPIGHGGLWRSTSRRSSEVRAQGSPPTKSFSGSSCCMARPRTALEDCRPHSRRAQGHLAARLTHTLHAARVQASARPPAPAPAALRSEGSPTARCPVVVAAAGVAARSPRCALSPRHVLASAGPFRAYRGAQTWRSAGARAQRLAMAGEPILNGALGTKAAADARHSARVRARSVFDMASVFAGGGRHRGVGMSRESCAESRGARLYC